MTMAAVQIPSPDYDNLVPSTRLCQVKEEGVADEVVDSVNVHLANSVAYNPRDAGNVGLLGTVRGGTFEGESGGARFSGGYKGGYGDSSSSCCNNTDGDRDISRASVVATCEADVKENEMGNELFTARTASVSDARAGSRDRGSKNGVCDKVRFSKGTRYNKETETRNKDASYVILHTEISVTESPTVSASVVSTEPKIEKCDKLTKETRGGVAHDVGVSSSHPVLTNAHADTGQKTPYISNFLEQSQETVNKSISENGESFTVREAVSTSSTVVSKTVSNTIERTHFPATSHLGQGSSISETSYVSRPPAPTANGQGPEHGEVTSFLVSSSDFKPAMAATHIPSTAIPTIIITQSIPEATSSTLPTLVSSPNPTAPLVSHTQSSKVATNEVEIAESFDAKHNAQVEISSTESTPFNESGKTLSKSAPVGGVKVLPSTFTFNFRKFQETKTVHSSTSSAHSENETAVTHLPSGHMLHEESVNATKGAKSVDDIKDPEHVSGGGVGTNVTRDITAASVSLPVATTTTAKAAVSSPTCPVPSGNTTTHQPPGLLVHGGNISATKDLKSLHAIKDHKHISENGAGINVTCDITAARAPLSAAASTAAKTSLSSGTSISENGHIPPEYVEETISLAKSTEEYTWNDYAVPSDLSLNISRSESNEAQFSSSDEHRNRDANQDGTRTNSGFIQRMQERVNASIPHTAARVSPDTECIYAIPIPKSQRRTYSLRSETYKQVFDQRQVRQTEPPQKPPRSPTYNVEPSQINDDDDAFDDELLRKTDHITNQMKKSTTTGMLHSYSGDYSNIPRAGSHKYDYFSLGRRPKRPRIKTLTDSKGMAVSLDMLLRLRRQSFVETANGTATDQNLSVDDILRSCSEFEQDGAFYRSRTNSESARKSSAHPLTFNEVRNVNVLISDTTGKEKHEKRSVPGTSGPILKKSQNTDTKFENRTALESNQNTAVQKSKANATTHSAQALTNYNGSRKTVISGKDSNGLASQEKSDVKASDQKQAAAVDSTAAKETTRKPDYVKSYFGLSPESNKNYYVSDNDDARNIHTSASSGHSKMSLGHAKLHSDYDCLKDNRVSQIPPARFAFPATGSSKNQPVIHEVDSALRNTKDIRPLKVQVDDSAVVATMVSQSANSRSHKQTGTEIPALTTNVSTLDTHAQSPHTTTSLSTSGQAATVTSSSHAMSSSTSEPPPSSGDFRHFSSSSSSDIPSPSLSVSVGSDSADVSSPGVLSLLSVEVGDTGLGDSPSPGRSSPNYNAKLEAAEALKWLRAAGFPQYAQMFDDGQFPVDMGVVERDHDFLDKDSLQSLFRRLETLNKYAGMRLDSHPCKKSTSEEDDEDDFCALSERWEYQKSARRWSRKDLSPSSNKATVTESSQRELAGRSGSHDSLLADQDSESQTGDSPLLESKMPHQGVVQHLGKNEMASVTHGGHAVAEITPESSDHSGSPISPRLRRAASDRMKTAKNLFKKMEGLKSTKSRRHHNHRSIVEISGPVVADREHMQAKLERLNCVDIAQTTESLPSPSLERAHAPDCINCGSLTGADGRRILPDFPNNQTPPQASSLPTSPRPHSDLMLRPRDASYPLTSHFTSTRQARSSHTSPTQPSPLGHDSSFDEYYHAQTTFLQNLQSTAGGTTEAIRKNNSDNNLMEIFLVPQDHQPGRFPRMLQNGYIETEACGTAVNARTGSVRLGRGTGVASDHRSANFRVAKSSSPQDLAHRLSVYDNCLPPESKRLEEGGSSIVIPSAAELGDSVDGGDKSRSFSQGVVDISKQGLIPKINFHSSQLDNVDTSRESSVIRTTESASDNEHMSSGHERSVSFESSSSSQTPREITTVTEEEITNTNSRSSGQLSSDSFSSKSRGVTHSSSVDSYFQGSSSHTEVPSNDGSENTPATTFQQSYDEFDRILQELYQNINDLSSFMDKDKNEKTPKLVRAATSPLPAGNKKAHSPLHVATPSAQPLLRPQQPAFDSSSPSSATSDLVPSPASPRSPQDTSESLDFYRSLDLDNENSSSGGEGSNTAESGSEDQEVVLTDVSHDDSLDQIIEVSRERRDSGVGHSLTRAPSDRRRKKIRWHSFQKSHRPDVSSRAMQINSLTVGQLVRLQKLSLLRLTGIMEKCLPVNKSGWNWMVPRFMKRHKAPDFSDKNVFGVPLSVMAQRTGQPLPQCVLYAMRYLRRTCQSAVGIFRKSGVKSKIQQLRDYLEAHPDTTNFDGENAYNVADMLKTYFRDLPECLLTNKMSETFRSIYTYVPSPQRLEAIQAAILLLPDENREVLQSILLFLSDISSHDADHQMNASNLAVCFTPTVFHLGPRQSVPYSPKRNRKNSSGVLDPREILEQKAAHECLLMMITDCKKLFTVPPNLFRQLQVQSLAHMEPTLPQDIGNSPADVRAFGQERIQMVLKESHDKNRGWVPTMTVGDVEVFHRKPMDDCPLKEWKLIVDIEAPPIEVLRRIMHERHTWDEDLLSWSVVERLDPHSDIFQFVLNSMAPHPPRNFCVLRYWRSDLNKGACALTTMSVEHSDALEIHGVWAIDLGTYFLMEPCGSGRSRLTYITRVDTKGRMPEWYTKIFGHICANFLERLKESFKQDTSGPETKV